MKSKRLPSVTLLAAGLALMVIGCAQPRIAPDNLRLTASLRTALSARNPEWLEQNVQAIAERHGGGAMSDEEFDAFQSIITQAKAGQWEQAEERVVRLQKAQRPTQEQIDKLVQVSR